MRCYHLWPQWSTGSHDASGSDTTGDATTYGSNEKAGTIKVFFSNIDELDWLQLEWHVEDMPWNLLGSYPEATRLAPLMAPIRSKKPRM